MNTDALLASLQSQMQRHVEMGGDKADPRFRRMLAIARSIPKRRAAQRGADRLARFDETVLLPLRRRIGDLKLVSIDTEWSPDGPAFDELGIATWRGGAIDVVRNLRTVAARRKPGRIYGLNASLDVARSIEVLDHHLRGADLYVMHGRRNDVTRLAMAGYAIPDIPCIDTLTWQQKAVGPELPAGLLDMCRRWGVPHRHRHVASNDAVATLRVAIAMILHGPTPTLDAQGVCVHPPVSVPDHLLPKDERP